MTRVRWLSVSVSAVLTIVASLLTFGAASAAGGTSLVPRFGNGVLQVQGSGFSAGENVTLAIDIAGAKHQVTTVADSNGSFSLNTGIAVTPGAAVSITAVGNQGSSVAVITAVSRPLAPAEPPPSAQLPRSGGVRLPIALGLGLAVLGGGLVLRRRTISR